MCDELMHTKAEWFRDQKLEISKYKIEFKNRIKIGRIGLSLEVSHVKIKIMEYM